MEVLLSTNKLVKRFGEMSVLNELSMSVRRGEIYGLLGLNGAGKTTTLKIILGLIKANSGEVYYKNELLKSSRKEFLKNIGVLVEAPSFYLNISARRNLRMFSRIYGKIEEDKISDLCRLVGLSGREDDRVSSYSLGMKQRLAIAHTLLSNPSLVILDEPTNGLDPQGIIEIRNLIRRLNKEQAITFIISSHLLAEVELMCDRVGIINKGRLVAESLLADIKGSSNVFVVKLTLAHQAKQALNAKLPDVEITVIDDGELELKLNGGVPSSLVNKTLVEAGVEVQSLFQRRVGLEEYFNSKALC